MSRPVALGLLLVGLLVGAGSTLIAELPAAEVAQALAPSVRRALAPPQPKASPGTRPQRDTRAPLRVLFLGNSYTGQSRLRETIGGFAAAAGLRPLEAVIDAPPGAGLQEHLSMGRYRQHLAGPRFDYVVLQEQSQRPSFRRKQRQLLTVAPARVLNEAIVRSGARTVLFSTWARREGDLHNVAGDSYAAMQQRVDQGYRELADELGAMVAPVGAVWKTVHEVSPGITLWEPDGSHPAPAGGYLAGCVLFRVLYDHPVTGNAFHGLLDPSDARRIQGTVDARLPPRQQPRLAAAQGSAPSAAPLAGILMATEAGCAAGYARFGDVCYHEELDSSPMARERAIAAYRAGAVPPQVGR